MATSRTRWDGPGLEAWSGAWTPWIAAEKLRGLAAPWCVVGGWAIDLFLGRQTRPHADLEIAIVHADLPVVRAHLADYRFHAVGDGEVRAMAADEPPPPETHQAWVLDEAAQLWRVDVMQEPGDHATWVFRRDHQIKAQRTDMVGVRDGVPYLRPQGALLYKAKARRPKDEADFDACLPHLDDDARTWLDEALGLAHPGHPWRARLA